MAARKARVEGAVSFGPLARLLTLALDGGEPMGFAGGQYIIIDTEIEIAGGKRAKRAYSLLSSDSVQHEVQIAVQRVGVGAASNFLQNVAVGAELFFSGPWGKWHAPEAPLGAPLIVATDTGITAALGLARGARFDGARGRLLWLRDAAHTFLPPTFVAERLPDGCELLDVPILPPVDHPERSARAIHWFDEVVLTAAPSFDRAFLVGDGDLILPLRDAIVRSGRLTGSDVQIECFFHNPARKAA